MGPLKLSWGHGQLARALGIDLQLQIDSRSVALEEGDLFLLTTDGVHAVLDDGELAEQLSEDLERSAAALVEAAYRAGSSDNLTALLVRIEELPKVDLDEDYRKLTELPFPPLLEPGMRIDGFEILRELKATKRVHIYRDQEL